MLNFDVSYQHEAIVLIRKIFANLMGKKKANQLGRALIKDRLHHGRRKVNESMLHTTEVQDGYDWGRLNLQSVTEESSFQDFLRTAEMAGTEFEAEKLNIAFVNPKSKVGLLTAAERVEIEKKHLDKKNMLKIPRRPAWTETMSAEQLQLEENHSFVEWRRGLAALQEQEGILLTPYEKNLEFWRQLWRVVERSDVIVQIVDARNPLLFRSEDLERYVKEVDENKTNMILLNKSDFLTLEQRKCWANYFSSVGMKVAFFSATLAEEEMSEERLQEEFEEILSLREKDSSTKILTRAELIQFFKSVQKGVKSTEKVATIGLVGYPNVGKSSTINALLTEKKVSVSATPGKTKHFQTLYVDSELMLCDCPGLVMPSFVSTKADMILNGILPIDQMRDYYAPVNLLCTYIPRHTLEDRYGMMIARPLEGEDPNRPPNAEELLLAHAYIRGFMTANGQPDQSRSARLILKDFVNGRLLYCFAPPGHAQDDFHKFAPRQKAEMDIEKLPPRQQRAMKLEKGHTSAEINETFFAEANPTAYVKGRFNFPNVRATSSSLSVTSDMPSATTSVDGSMVSLAGIGEKPWKNRKKEKREKLRKKYAYLDEH